jgi:hypothetical protein
MSDYKYYNCEGLCSTRYDLIRDTEITYHVRKLRMLVCDENYRGSESQLSKLIDRIHQKKISFGTLVITFQYYNKSSYSPEKIYQHLLHVVNNCSNIGTIKIVLDLNINSDKNLDDHELIINFFKCCNKKLLLELRPHVYPYSYSCNINGGTQSCVFELIINSIITNTNIVLTNFFTYFKFIDRSDNFFNRIICSNLLLAGVCSIDIDKNMAMTSYVSQNILTNKKIRKLIYRNTEGDLTNDNNNILIDILDKCAISNIKLSLSNVMHIITNCKLHAILTNKTDIRKLYISSCDFDDCVIYDDFLLTILINNIMLHSIALCTNSNKIIDYLCESNIKVMKIVSENCAILKILSSKCVTDADIDLRIETPINSENYLIDLDTLLLGQQLKFLYVKMRCTDKKLRTKYFDLFEKIIIKCDSILDAKICFCADGTILDGKVMRSVVVDNKIRTNCARYHEHQTVLE